MKRFLALILVVLLIPVVSLAQGIDLKSMTDDQLKELAAAIMTEQQTRIQSNSGYLASGTIDDIFVGLKSVKVDKDSNGNKIAILTYDFSHSKDEAASFMFAALTKVFQDGIACETSYYYNGENSMTEIKKGVMIQVSDAFIIKSNSPLEIEIAPAFSFTDEKIETTVTVQ
jgi:hypothetical protein